MNGRLPQWNYELQIKFANALDFIGSVRPSSRWLVLYPHQSFFVSWMWRRLHHLVAIDFLFPADSTLWPYRNNNGSKSALVRCVNNSHPLNNQFRVRPTSRGHLLPPCLLLSPVGGLVICFSASVRCCLTWRRKAPETNKNGRNACRLENPIC